MIVGARPAVASTAMVISRLRLLDRHREELRLLARYEEPVDAQVFDPMVDVGAKPLFVDGAVGPKGRERGRPKTAHAHARISLRVLPGVTHRRVLPTPAPAGDTEYRGKPSRALAPAGATQGDPPRSQASPSRASAICVVRNWTNLLVESRERDCYRLELF